MKLTYWSNSLVYSPSKPGGRNHGLNGLLLQDLVTCCFGSLHQKHHLFILFLMLARIQLLKKAGRKYPYRLVDSCKRSSVNQIVAGSRLSWCIMDFFSCLQLFKHTVPNLTSLAGCRTWCPTDLQYLYMCCKALINK